MEQAQYRMRMKRRQIWLKSSHIEATMNSYSWEERAFAEDHASGSLNGGCAWPPRSYSCSFCKREFRSAQALGGHMNVHRRDRARLKQQYLSPDNSNTNDVPRPQNIPSQSDRHSNSSSFLSSSSKFSSFPTLENPSNKHTFLKADSPYIYNIVPRSDSLAIRLLNKEGSMSFNDDFSVKTGLFMGLNSSCGDGHEEISCKSPKSASAASTLSFLINPCSNERFTFKSEAIRANSTSIDDIDLELRLGEPPKVK